jgi:hypothetical protein
MSAIEAPMTTIYHSTTITSPPLIQPAPQTPEALPVVTVCLVPLALGVAYAFRSGRFRFTLRAFLIFLTIQGIALGWLGLQLKWIEDRHESLSDSAYFVVYHESAVGPAHAPWGIRILGEDGVAVIIVAPGSPDNVQWRDPDRLQRLFPEATISRRAWQVDE